MDWFNSLFKSPKKICPECPVTKCPEVKCPVTKCPEVKCPDCPVDNSVYKIKKILDDVLESKLDNLLRHVFKVMKKIKDDNPNTGVDKKVVELHFNKSYDNWKNSPGLQTFLDKVCKSDPNDLKIEFEKRLNYKRSFNALIPVNSEPIYLPTYKSIIENRKSTTRFRTVTRTVHFHGLNKHNNGKYISKRVLWGKPFTNVPKISLMMNYLDCSGQRVSFWPKITQTTRTGCTVSILKPKGIKMWGVSYIVFAHNQFNGEETMCQTGRVNARLLGIKTTHKTVKFKKSFSSTPKVVPFLTGIGGYRPKVRVNVIKTNKYGCMMKITTWDKDTSMNSVRIDYVAIKQSKNNLLRIGTTTKQCYGNKSKECKNFTNVKTRKPRILKISQPVHHRYWFQVSGVNALDFGGKGNIRIDNRVSHKVRTWADTLLWGSSTSNVYIKRNYTITKQFTTIKPQKIVVQKQNNHFAKQLEMKHKELLKQQSVIHIKNLNNQAVNYQNLINKLNKTNKALRQTISFIKNNNGKDLNKLKKAHDDKLRYIIRLEKLNAKLQQQNLNYKRQINNNKPINIIPKLRATRREFLAKYGKELNILNILVFELSVYIIQSNFCSKDRTFMFEKLRIIITSIIGSFYNFELDYDKLSEHDKLVIKTPIIKLLGHLYQN